MIKMERCAMKSKIAVERATVEINKTSKPIMWIKRNFIYEINHC